MTQYVYINENREASYNPKEGYTAQCEINLWNAVYSRPENYDRWEIRNGEFYILTDEEYSVIQQAKENERIAKLHLTRGDVFRGLLQAKQVTREQLRALILAMPDGIAKEMALIDFDEALEFYRGNALIDTVGAQLGITTKQMDRFFETNDYTELTREEIPQSA